MITFYSPGAPGVQLESGTSCAELTAPAVWIDLFQPTTDEEKALEAALGINIPTREEMQEIELSSRLYKEGDSLYMTGIMVTNASSDNPTSSAVTFIVMPNRLVTLRYAEPQPFVSFRSQRQAHPEFYRNGHDVLAGLLDAIIDRVADILESVGGSLDRISLRIFDAEAPDGGSNWDRQPQKGKSGRRRRQRQGDFVDILRRIGCTSDLVSRARESLVSFARVVAYYREMQHENPAAREALVHLKTVAGDLGSLSDHATFMSGKISFLLEATLGMINNEQNGIIKIVSVAAVVFLPPTLVASVYGMNFEVMPELKWVAGYPFALILMVISAVLPYAIFKRKGWL
ncbi:MAG: magnesium transporter CorA family protein [Chthoniobacterales bacterium]|nr:magnesium transporter CorA family protein [Chthoniobacterales bacterium]